VVNEREREIVYDEEWSDEKKHEDARMVDEIKYEDATTREMGIGERQNFRQEKCQGP
jgi:hypothetical protein